MKTALLLWSVLFVGPAVAQNFFATDLVRGPYTVGFKAGVHFDLGRPPLQEQFARFSSGRAVHLSVWYPAKVKANHPRMMFGEYVDEISRMVNPREVTKKTRAESIHGMNATLTQLGGDSTVLLKHLGGLMNATTHAYRNASLHSGTFPIVIYPESAYLNNILSEYLASHGYIVVSVSRHGTFNTDFEWQTVRGIETLVQDCQFALSVIKKEFNTDGKIAAMGTGMNASAGLAWMMRNSNVDAFVSLEGGILTAFEYHLLRKSPFFDSTRVSNPMLVIHSPHEAVNPELIDHYPYADRFMLQIAQLSEFYYLNFGIWENTIPGILGPAPGNTKLGFEWMARYTLYFLDWKLKQGDHGRIFYESSPEQNGMPSGLASYTFKEGVELPSPN